MGGKLSSEYSSYGSSASSWDPQQGYLQTPYNHENQTGHRSQSQPSHSSPPDYPPRPTYSTQSSYSSPPDYPPQPAYSTQPTYSVAPEYSTQPSYAEPQDYPPPGYGGVPAWGNRRRLDKRYSRIADSYSSLEQVTEALARAGLESSNLIVGIDFTKSNEWTGAKSFNKRSLHHIGDGFNPYEQAISIIGRTLAAFDDDNMIPCFGFGDASTHDQDVFSFYPNERYCNGFEEVLHCYREIVPHLRLAGPTSFAPIIEMAMTIVEKSGGQYHVLLIIADGQVTRSVDTEPGRLSPQEQKTVEAIVEASKFPLSIILVGVGDGPWDTMREFDDNIPARDFDNFQFVNFTHIMSKNVPPMRKETEFALTALMEVPTQYRATVELGLLGSRKGNSPQRVPLPPPAYGAPSMASPQLSRPLSFEPTQPSIPPYYGDSMPASSALPVDATAYDSQICPICLTNVKDMAFGCGHQTCRDCGQYLELCPICRSRIQTRIKLY